jgi:hypothetical protein
LGGEEYRTKVNLIAVKPEAGLFASAGRPFLCLALFYHRWFLDLSNRNFGSI